MRDQSGQGNRNLTSLSYPQSHSLVTDGSTPERDVV